MGNCPIFKDSYCCKANKNVSKIKNFDSDIQIREPISNDSNLDKSKDNSSSQFVFLRSTEKRKLLMDKNLLNKSKISNKLDDEDQVIHLRRKHSRRKKIKHHKYSSNYFIGKRMSLKNRKGKTVTSTNLKKIKQKIKCPNITLISAAKLTNIQVIKTQKNQCDSPISNIKENNEIEENKSDNNNENSSSGLLKKNKKIKTVDTKDRLNLNLNYLDISDRNVSHSDKNEVVSAINKSNSNCLQFTKIKKNKFLINQKTLTMESNLKKQIDELSHSHTMKLCNIMSKNKVTGRKKNTKNTNSVSNNSKSEKSDFACYNNCVKSSKKKLIDEINKDKSKDKDADATSDCSDESCSPDVKFRLFASLDKEEEEFIKNFIKQNSFFLFPKLELDEDSIKLFASGFYCAEFIDEQLLFNEKEEAKIFYVIYSGSVLLYNNIEEKNNYNDQKKNNNNNINPLNNLFSTLNPRIYTFQKVNENNKNINNDTKNENLLYSNTVSPTLKNKLDNRKKLTYSTKNEINIAESRLLTKGDFFGQDCFKENSHRTQCSKIMQKTRILCCSGEFYRNIKNYIHLKLMNERIEILKNVPLFKYMGERMLKSFAKKMVEKEYNQFYIVTSENEMCNYIYIIKYGEIKLTKKYIKIKILEKNSYFGHISLIMKVPNLYTYSVNTEKVVLYQIPYTQFNGIKMNEIIFKLFLNSIKTSERIRQLFIDNFEYFYNNVFKLKYYEDNKVIYTKNHLENKKLCVIITGGLKSSNSNKNLADAETAFGDNIVDLREDLKDEIISNGETIVFEAIWNDIVHASENNKKNNKGLLETVKNLKKVRILKNLSEIDLLELSKVVTIETFKENKIISQEGELSKKFYIIKEGKVKLYKKSNFIREIDQGGFFGEIPETTGTVIFFTAIAGIDDTECYCINKKYFPMLDPSVLKLIKDREYLNDVNIELSDLFVIRLLGKGKFGKVFLVHNQRNFYAIKTAAISEIVKEKKDRFYLNEKKIMKMIDYPFAIKLVKTLNNETHIFFLQEYIEGITLRTYIQKRKKSEIKNLEIASFYGIIMLLTLNYIHSKKIIHRDIKPGNIMIDKKGYLKLIDFGISKCLKDDNLTNTMCGTPHYIAPEVIIGKGYSFSADFWSYGVTLFEVFYDYLPFGSGVKDSYEIYNQILYKKLILPYGSNFNIINSFFKVILSKNIMHRICNFQLLKSQCLFEDYDCEQILNQSIKAPFIPERSDKINDLKNLTLYSKSIKDYFREEDALDENKDNDNENENDNNNDNEAAKNADLFKNF